MNSKRLARMLVVISALGLGCKPAQPTITPRSVAVTGTTSAGLGLQVHLLVNNPNRIDFTVQSIDAHVIMAGVDLGRSTVQNATRLPSNQDVGIDANLTATWNDLPRLLMSTAMTENVPYHLDGTVSVGSSDIHFNVPFQVDSTLPRRILVEAGRNAMPSGLPTEVPTQVPTQLPPGFPTPPPGVAIPQPQ